MNLRLLVLIAAVLLPWGMMAAEQVVPELQRVAAALRPVLEKLEPQAEIMFPENSGALAVHHQTQPFKIHARSMTGEISTNAHDEIGPGFRGFVLSVQLQELGEVNQAVTPQTLQQPYWKTDLEVTPLGGTRKQMFWALSYGSRMDAAVLGQIRKTLQGLKGEVK